LGHAPLQRRRRFRIAGSAAPWGRGLRLAFDPGRVLRVKAQKHVGDPLRVGRGAEDFALVVL
jgi:hypothetical protein